MRSKGLLALALVLSACPERAQPERGVALTYAKAETAPSELRAVVDRRLARMKLKAHLSEDRKALTVRVPNGLDLERIKTVLARPGVLSFCEEDAALSRRVLCERAWPDGIELDQAKDSCALASIDRERLQREVSALDAGVELVFEKVDARVTGYVKKQGSCFDPHVIGVDVQREPMPSLMVEFDKNATGLFNALTARVVGAHLLILLDGEVSSAPVVMEPISGNRAMLTFGRKEDLEVMAAVLAGGPLPGLTLEKEARYGPPTLSVK